MRVWDPVVRSIHWTVAALVAVDLLNEAGANPWHRYIGYAAVALVASRLAWGMLDTGHARLSRMAKKALSAHRSFTGVPDVAHTPLGALMAFALWSLVLLAGVTGWMLGLDAFWGEQWLQDLHAALSYALAGCMVVHVAAAIVTSRLQRVNLVKAMVTGEKAIPQP